MNEHRRLVPLHAHHVLLGRLVLRRRRRCDTFLHDSPRRHDLGRRLPDRGVVVGRAGAVRLLRGDQPGALSRAVAETHR